MDFDAHSAAAAPSAHEHNPGSASRSCALAAMLLLAVYAAGMSRDINERWTGMHDWNGAFYSQLARNFLRYPWPAHHGLPLVAVGSDAPPQQRSIYPTHPPGVVWILAVPFALVGESEWIARFTAVAASLISLWLLMALVARSAGWRLALLAGVVYAILPMDVYYGRMVNHEPYCQALMLAGVAAWEALLRSNGRRFSAVTAWAAATVACIWIDWPGVIFAGLCGVDAMRRYRRGQLRGVQTAAAFAVVGIATVGLIAYLVYAGMGGRWGDLWAVFTARSGADAPQGAATGWQQTAENLTIPGTLLVLLGAIVCLSDSWRRRASQQDRREPAVASHRALWIVHATGIIWTIVFWRQYRIHGYWAFYLGPAAAILCAVGIERIGVASSRANRGLGRFALVAVLAVVLVVALNGAQEMFDRTQVPVEWIDAWTAAKDDPNASLGRLVPPNPIRDERWGETCFRNVVPPHLAWYLDRLPDDAWTATSDVDP